MFCLYQFCTNRAVFEFPEFAQSVLVDPSGVGREQHPNAVTQLSGNKCRVHSRHEAHGSVCVSAVVLPAGANHYSQCRHLFKGAVDNRRSITTSIDSSLSGMRWSRKFDSYHLAFCFRRVKHYM